MSVRMKSYACAVVLLLGLNLVYSPTADALPKYEIETAYYDACLDVIYERVIGCLGEVWTWGTSSAGAVYKNVVQIECEGSGYYSTWYEWNGSSWVALPGMPPNC